MDKAVKDLVINLMKNLNNVQSQINEIYEIFKDVQNDIERRLGIEAIDPLTETARNIDEVSVLVEALSEGKWEPETIVRAITLLGDILRAMGKTVTDTCKWYVALVNHVLSAIESLVEVLRYTS